MKNGGEGSRATIILDEIAPGRRRRQTGRRWQQRGAGPRACRSRAGWLVGRSAHRRTGSVTTSRRSLLLDRCRTEAVPKQSGTLKVSWCVLESWMQRVERGGASTESVTFTEKNRLHLQCPVWLGHSAFRASCLMTASRRPKQRQPSFLHVSSHRTAAASFARPPAHRGLVHGLVYPAAAVIIVILLLRRCCPSHVVQYIAIQYSDYCRAWPLLSWKFICRPPSCTAPH